MPWYHGLVRGVTAVCSVRFNVTGTVQTYTVPAGVYFINVKVWGAQGGGLFGGGGRGTYLEGTLSVTPGTTYDIYVGDMGGGGDAYSLARTGWPNGGASDLPHSFGGGGSSAIVPTGGTMANAIVVSGGGGGGTDGGITDFTNSEAGGGGGYTDGLDAPDPYMLGGPGQGATQSGPGGDGDVAGQGHGGAGGTGGGGGGGFHGGGSGSVWNGGGGGSSLFLQQSGLFVANSDHVYQEGAVEIEWCSPYICYDQGWKWSGNTSRTFTGMVEQPLTSPYPGIYVPQVSNAYEEQQIVNFGSSNWRPDSPRCQYSTMTRLVEIGDIGSIIEALIADFHTQIPSTWDSWTGANEHAISWTGWFEEICRMDFFYRVTRSTYNAGPGHEAEKGFAIDGFFVFYYMLVDSTGGPYAGNHLTYTNEGSVLAYANEIPGTTTPGPGNAWATTLVGYAAAESNQILMSTNQESTKTPDNLYNGTYGNYNVRVGINSGYSSYPVPAVSIETAFPGAAFFEGNHSSADWAALIAAYNAA